METQSKVPAFNLPPDYRKIEKHEIFPEFSHDETARYNFLANLTKHVSQVVAPANKIAFDKRVQPNFQKENGRDFENRDELKAAMKKEPVYQTWSALRRSIMEMRQQNGRSVVLRQAEDLAQKAQKLSNLKRETLKLDPNLQTPHYLSIMDNHCMPGSYHTEYVEGDVANAANYDTGLFVSTAGGLGKLSDGGGRAIVAWLKQNYPDFKPKNILDIGCGLGHNTLPLAMGYPEAKVIGIDTGAPMIRYGHARSVALGIQNVAFEQVNAEKLPYPDASFDWVQTTMFLHETSNSAMNNFIKEIHRILKPGGIMLHIEQPQYTPQMSMYEQFMRDWDAYHNNEPFWGAMHDVDVDDWMVDGGFERKRLLHFGAAAVNDLEDFTKPKPKEAEDFGRTALWNVFGAWK
jgi:SAM-dependent methyltransferase